MGNKTGIEWTDATWNPLRGCSPVSRGCKNCYASRYAKRFSGPGAPFEGLVRINAAGERTDEWNGDVHFVEKHLLDPLRWKRPRRIFVNSVSDLFHENVADEWIDRIFAVMALCPQHTFQVLTKRPERMLAYMGYHYPVVRPGPREAVYGIVTKMRGYNREHPEWLRLACATSSLLNKPLLNVWLGVSVEDQDAADKRIPLLLRTPAALRFISVEPMLGPVSMRWKNSVPFGTPHPRYKIPLPDKDGRVSTDEYDGLREIDWVICGGESGPGARGPMHPDWARSLRDQCAAAEVAFFFKQWGELLPVTAESEGPHVRVIDGQKYLSAGKKAAGALLDGREWRQVPR